MNMRLIAILTTMLLPASAIVLVSSVSDAPEEFRKDCLGPGVQA